MRSTDTFPRPAPVPISVIAAAALSAAITLALPLSVLFLYDRAFPTSSTSSIVVLCTCLFAALFVDTAMDWLRTKYYTERSFRYERALFDKFARYLVFAPADIVQKEASPLQIGRLKAIRALRIDASEARPNIYLNAAISFVALCVIASINVWITLIPITLLIALCLAVWLLGTKLHHTLAHRQIFDDRRRNFLHEVFAKSDELKSQGIEAAILARYERLLYQTTKDNYRQAYLNSLLNASGEILAHLTIFLTASCAAFLVQRGQLSMGELAACTLLAGRTIPTALNAVGQWSKHQAARVARETLRCLNAPVELPTEPANETRQATDLLLFVRSKASHQTDAMPLFQAKTGERIALTGPDGSGKSAILNAIIEDKTTSDSIQVEVRHEATKEPLARSFGDICLVRYPARLFHGTLLDNITLFDAVKLDDAAHEILAALGIPDLVSKLPSGYETPVRRGSLTVSEDLTCRLALAQAILRQPQILLIDEMNNGLSRDGDAALDRTLEVIRAQTLVIQVANRPSVLRRADRVYRFERRTSPLDIAPVVDGASKEPLRVIPDARRSVNVGTLSPSCLSLSSGDR